jgi:hypothetical protein
MAFNSFNPTINSLRIENKSQSKQIKFSSKKICFKKSWNGLNLNNNNNNNIYCNYNNNNENNNCFKSDSKEQKLNSIQLKSSVENVVENVVEMTSNKDFIQTDMSFSSPGMKDVPQWLKGFNDNAIDDNVIDDNVFDDNVFDNNVFNDNVFD